MIRSSKGVLGEGRSRGKFGREQVTIGVIERISELKKRERRKDYLTELNSYESNKTKRARKQTNRKRKQTCTDMGILL